MTSLYTCRSEETGFRLTKLDADFNLLSSYHITAEGNCECPQGHKPTCRHRKMLPEFARAGHVDDGWFLDWDTRMWRQPASGANLSQQDAEAKAEEERSPSSPPSVGKVVASSTQEAPVRVEVEASP